MLTRTRALGAAASVALMVAAGSTAAVASTPSAANGHVRAHAAKHLTVGLASEGLEAPFPVAIAKGVQLIGQKDHIKVITLDGKETVSTQEAGVQDLIAEHVSGIIIDVIDPGATEKMIKQANAAHIPVMLVHGYAGKGPKPVYPGVKYEIDENEVRAGQQAAAMARKADPKGGQVAIITGTPGYVAVTEREHGFTSKLPASYKVVSVQPGNWTASGGYSACSAIYHAHPNLALVYTESDDMALGCVKAEQSASVHPAVVSIGGELQVKAMIREGKVYGTVCYEPKTEGEVVMKAMDALLTKKAHYNRKLDFYATPSVTKANLNNCGWQW